MRLMAIERALKGPMLGQGPAWLEVNVKDANGVHVSGVPVMATLAFSPVGTAPFAVTKDTEADGSAILSLPVMPGVDIVQLKVPLPNGQIWQQETAASADPYNPPVFQVTFPAMAPPPPPPPPPPPEEEEPEPPLPPPGPPTVPTWPTTPTPPATKPAVTIEEGVAGGAGALLTVLGFALDLAPLKYVGPLALLGAGAATAVRHLKE